MSHSQFNFKSSGIKLTDNVLNKNKEQTLYKPIGIKTPLEYDGEVFKMHINPIEQLADNFRNLIMTNKGERLGRHSFGANLKSLVYDYSNSPDFDKILAETIIAETQKYIPEIQILNVENLKLEKNEKKELNEFGVSKVKIKISYLIPKLKSPKLGLEVDIIVGG